MAFIYNAVANGVSTVAAHAVIDSFRTPGYTVVSSRTSGKHHTVAVVHAPAQYHCPEALKRAVKKLAPKQDDRIPAYYPPTPKKESFLKRLKRKLGGKKKASQEETIAQFLARQGRQ